MHWTYASAASAYANRQQSFPPRRPIMRYARHVAMLLGAAGIAMVAMSGDRTYSQGNGPNAYPNPYQLQENWAKLPPGRTRGSSIGVDIDPAAGTALRTLER